MKLIKDVRAIVFNYFADSGDLTVPEQTTSETVTLNNPVVGYGDNINYNSASPSATAATTGAQKAIRLSTGAEKAAMASAYTYAGMENLLKTFKAYGTPIYWLPAPFPKSYISIWYGSFGPSFHTFVGYTSGFPSQDVVPDAEAAKAPTQYVFKPEQLDLQALEFSTPWIAQITGYDGAPVYPSQYSSMGKTLLVPGVNVPPIGASNINVPIFPSGYTVKSATVTTTYPAHAPIKGSGESPSEIQRTLFYDKGWNSWARSIDPLLPGHFFQANVSENIAAAFFGIGKKGMDGRNVNGFSHGIMVDGGSVSIFEAGRAQRTLNGEHLATSDIKIFRGNDNLINYAITTGSETIVLPAVNLVEESTMEPLYVYCYLYSGGDIVLDAEFAEGAVQYGSAEFSGSSSFEVQNCDLFMEGTGTITFGASMAVRFSGTGNLHLDPTYAFGRADFPAFGCFGTGGISEHLGFGSSMFPAFTSEAMGDVYVPPQAGEGIGIFTPFVSVGIGVSISIGTGSSTFPAFSSKGGDYAYGEGSASFPAIFSTGSGNRIPLELDLFSFGVIQSAEYLQREMVIFLSSSGQVESIFTGTTQIIAQFLSSLLAESSLSYSSVHSLELMSPATARDFGFGSLDDDISFGAPARVWVVNLETGASSQYDDYGFNSFFQDDTTGEYFGIADDGIYRLDGDDDAGAEIAALIDAGRSDLGSPYKKGIVNVYAGVSSTGKMILKVDADEQVYFYEARSNSTVLKNHRFDVGKGLQGNYYDLTLLNQNGDDFDLEMITFEPVVYSRKI
ncbi:MAG TPA: hypothetical protein DCZ63_15195 [Geobacter sp.]|nr:hypothetical protein [Geobacter sp.]